MAHGFLPAPTRPFTRQQVGTGPATADRHRQADCRQMRDQAWWPLSTSVSCTSSPHLRFFPCKMRTPMLRRPGGLAIGSVCIYSHHPAQHLPEPLCLPRVKPKLFWAVCEAEFAWTLLGCCGSLSHHPPPAGVPSAPQTLQAHPHTCVFTPCPAPPTPELPGMALSSIRVAMRSSPTTQPVSPLLVYFTPLNTT